MSAGPVPRGLTVGTGPEAERWQGHPPFLETERPSLQVQAVLYKTEAEGVQRSLDSLARSAELATLPDGRRVEVSVRYGDGSPLRVLEGDQVEDLQERYRGILTIDYQHFGDNLGSARGHNTLADGSEAGFIMTLNPDVVLAPRTINHLLSPFARTGVGMTEAKQLPIEHPKDYDRTTGDTAWAATACAVFPRVLFEEIGGFDAETFFMYCDDVDFSWSVRLRGLRVIHQPAAVVFHDKRLGLQGNWQPTSAERYYSAEAALLLMHKWSREELALAALADFEAAEDDHYRRAAAEFRRRRDTGQLPVQVDGDHRVGVFTDGFYAPHRYAL